MRNDNNKTKKRRRPAKRRPSVLSTTRIDEDLRDRCLWRAIELGTSQAEVHRAALAAFCAGAKPPQTPDTVVLLGVSDGRRDAWEAVARKMELPLSDTIHDLMDGMALKHFKSKPYLRNGKWCWDGIENA